jgi:hypothetical protein
VAQDDIRAIVGVLQGRDYAAMAHPVEGSMEEVCREIVHQLAPQIVLARQR